MRGGREGANVPIVLNKRRKLAAAYAIKVGKEEHLSIIELGSFRWLEFGGSSI